MNYYCHIHIIATHNKEARHFRIGLLYLAEREGFEPSVRGYRTPDFESGTFDHSATSPGRAFYQQLLIDSCKKTNAFNSAR